MLGRILFQFVVEILRALLIDVLSDHVRRRIAVLLNIHLPGSRRSVAERTHHRNRERLMHRLRTEVAEEL